jgi:hypothetical protein
VRHCQWCGVFVAKTAEPIVGANVNGVPREQLLCPECAQYWIELTRCNMERIEQRHELGFI